MKLRTLAIYLVAAALVCLVTGVAARADVIDFESLPPGPSSIGGGPPQTLNFSTSSGLLTITGGTILTNTTFLPADESTVYATESGLSNSITFTLAFTSPVNNFFFDLINGDPFLETYLVSDNLGNSSSFAIPPNFALGAVTVDFPTVGSVITITCPNCDFIDFAVDNIGFNQPTPGTTVPEPGSMTLLGLGALGLAAVKLSKK